MAQLMPCGTSKVLDEVVGNYVFVCLFINLTNVLCIL